MLRIYTSTSVAEAKSYYTSDRQEAYYSGSQEFHGYWGGRAARMLGLEGPVDSASFGLLCENRHPVTGDQLTPRTNSTRRVLYDFNFNCPKSVSLAYFYHKDERIMREFRQSVQIAMEKAEELIGTRVRRGQRNRDDNRLTQNMVRAEVIHLTARPENGICDPHLHSHVVVFNATFDEAENRWKAAQFGDINKAADHLQAIFLSELSHGLKGIGYEIEQRGKWFEIAGLPRELNKEFSRRSEKIKAVAAERGITDPKAKSQLAASTREKKVKNLLIPELEQIWWSRLKPEHERALDGLVGPLTRCEKRESILASGRSSQQLSTRQQMSTAAVKPDEELSCQQFGRSGTIPTDSRQQRKVSLNRLTKPVEGLKRDAEITEDDRRAVAFAMEHLFERQSVATHDELVTEAIYSWGYGKATWSGITKVIAETPFIRVEQEGVKLLTTQEILNEENRIVDRCIFGKWKFPALNPQWQIQDAKLNLQQKEAVFHVLGSRDFITGISGKAGTGKTTLLQEAKRGIEASGTKLLVLAPSAEAAREVLPNEGFRDAETVAKLLASETLQKQSWGAVWWVDEAGLLPTRQADKLINLAAKCGARLVLVGDAEQHHAVERGQAFDLLQNIGRMSTAKVEEIQRQKGAYKRFVEQVVAKDFEGAFMSLENMDAIQELAFGEREKALAKDYLSVIEKGKSALIVSPTHKECESVTKAVRDALKEKGLVAGEGVQWSTLDNLSWTSAQKRDARKYEPGLMVQINSHAKGFALGEQMEIVKVGESQVIARNKDGVFKDLPLSKPDAFCVYERQAIEVCPGDRIRITTNSRDANGHRLHNGNLYTVDHFAPDGKMVLENGWGLDSDFAHLKHGYAATSHGCQGKTVDWVFVVQSGKIASPASDAKQFYVSVTRGREGVKAYTDEIEALRDSVSQVRERPMATELIQDEQESSVHDQTKRIESSDLLGKSQNENLSHETERLLGIAREVGAECGKVPKQKEPEMEQEFEIEMSM